MFHQGRRWLLVGLTVCGALLNVLAWAQTADQAGQGLLNTPVEADKRVVFGSFEGRTNAANWALRMSTRYAIEVDIEPIETTAGEMFRVVSRGLDDELAKQVINRLQVDGIDYWLLSVSDAQEQKVTKAPQSVPAPRSSRASSSPTRVNAITPNPPRDESAVSQISAGSQFEGELGLESRYFTHKGPFENEQLHSSVSLEFEWFVGWQNDQHSITVRPFLRLDHEDNERTHADLREAYYSLVGSNWDLHIGARKVFWGVTEFSHLVDVINQTDLVENIDGEDKLGQPMVQLSLVRDWGLLDVFALPGFRERTYPGEDGRLRFALDVEDGQYESGAEQHRVDAAIRWSKNFGPLEVALHHFSGTSREPQLQIQSDGQGNLGLLPYYPVIDQTGIDSQLFWRDWALKLEGFSRSGFGSRYATGSVGFERTFYGVGGSAADIGLVAEYIWDERDEFATSIFEDDVALGGRFQFNDLSDTQALLGVVFDRQNDEYVVSLEGSRQLPAGWLLNVEGRVFAGGDSLQANNVLFSLIDPEQKSGLLQTDDYIQIELRKFF